MGGRALRSSGSKLGIVACTLSIAFVGARSEGETTMVFSGSPLVAGIAYPRPSQRQGVCCCCNM